jgi:predicted nucleic acid-binding protein
MRIVLLDAGPLGLVTNPRPSAERIACAEWLRALLIGGAQSRVPEIADYEIRRELLRSGRQRGLARLDALAATLGYLPLSTDVIRQAAEFWALARTRGRPAASDAAIDADMILCAQATLAGGEDDEIIVATTNVGHLSLFVDARTWRDITP